MIVKILVVNGNVETKITEHTNVGVNIDRDTYINFCKGEIV